MIRPNLERDWTTASGLRAVCVLSSMGHRCGYVQIPEAHWLHGIGYSEDIGVPPEAISDEAIGARNPIDLVLIGSGDSLRSGYLFDVHGSVTFSGQPYVNGKNLDGFWYGFDCAHWNDRDDPKREEYVVAECERLAEQVAVKWAEKPALTPTPPERKAEK